MARSQNANIRPSVNYDQIASTYDQRFAVSRQGGIAAALLALVQDLSAERVLEVGCGTGRWLADLQPVVHQSAGLDLSAGMLQQARKREVQFRLVQGRAEQLPFPGATFDLLYCVNALHHFSYPRTFISEARRLLRPDGALAVVGMDPHGAREQWYVYHYFEGTYEADVERFPSRKTVLDWMAAEGLREINWRLVEHILHPWVGRAVLDDPFLEKDSTSQLVLLTDEAYTAGLRRIEAALAQAEAAGKTLVFPVDIPLAMLVGRV